jgi:hypothetical protein
MQSGRSIGFTFLLTVAIALGFLALARPAEALIYFGFQSEDDDSNVSDLDRSTLDGGSVEENFLNFRPTGGPAVLAANGGYIYWGDRVNGSYTIGRAAVDGSNVDRTFIEHIPNRVIDLEAGGGRIFWLAGDYENIGRANADGSGVEIDWRSRRPCEASETTGCDAVHQMALTPAGGALFADATYAYPDAEGDLRSHRAIFNIDPSSGAAAVIADLGLDSFGQGIAANATHVYFSHCQRSDTGMRGGVGRLPIEGGTADMNFFVPSVEGGNGYCNGVFSVDDADASHVYVNWRVTVCPPIPCSVTQNISTVDIESKAVTHVLPNRNAAVGGIAVDDLTTFPRRSFARSINLKYKQKKDQIVGSISSDEPLCERGVTVRLYRKGSSAAFRSDQTGTEGTYVMKNVTKRGKYHAEVAAEQKSGGICVEAESASVRVG